MAEEDSKSSAAVIVALVGAPVFVVLLLVVVLVGGGDTPPPCGAGGGSAPGVGTLKVGGIPANYVPLIQKGGTVCPEFPAPVIAAQLDQESGFSDPTSSTGAQGPAQFEPASWVTWGNGGNVHDPVAAIDAQARFDCALAGQVKTAQAAGQIHSSASVTEMALGGYNAGFGAVEASGGIPQNSQTMAYVPRIMNLARTTFSEAGTLAAPGGAPAPDAPPTGGGDQAAGGCGGAPQVQVLALTYPGVSGPHAVDVYLPPGGGPGKTPVPMVVAIHGGGWFFGDRHELDQVSRDAAMHGYVIINGDYTLDAPRYPRELDDVRAEIAWARAHAGEWGGDPAKMATWGDSAGANLAVTVATTGDHAGLQAAVGWSGPYSLADLPSGLTAASTDYQKLASIADPAIYTGCLPIFCPQVYTAVSPAVSATPGAPPVYLANSQTELVPLAQQDQMVATLARLGVPHQAVVVPGTGHATAYQDQQTQPTLTWLDHTLGFTPPPVGGGVGSGGGGPRAQQVVAAAHTQLGLPYIWGGGGYNGPTGGGFDCSGLTSYAFHQVGLDLPRTAQAQYAATAATRVSGGFTPAAYQPGDLLFYGTDTNIHHVAIAIGNGQLIQASTFGEPLNIKPIYNGGDFYAATRPLGTSGAPQ